MTRKISYYLFRTIVTLALSVTLYLAQFNECSYVPCDMKSPLNTSNNTCGDLCDKNATCDTGSGVCVCSKEPGASMLGGHFTHCTNWDYVEQKSCSEACTKIGTNDHRVCWTVLIGNYCTCFNKKMYNLS